MNETITWSLSGCHRHIRPGPHKARGWGDLLRETREFSAHSAARKHCLTGAGKNIADILSRRS